MRKWYVIYIVLLTLVACALIVLPASTCKEIYILKAYVLGLDESLLKPSSEYTGVWREWREDGSLYSSAEYHNGELNGELKYYQDSVVCQVDEYEFGSLVKSTRYDNGNIKYIQYPQGKHDVYEVYRDGNLVRTERSFSTDSGQHVLHIKEFKLGHLHREYYQYSDSKDLVSHDTVYLNGIVVSQKLHGSELIIPN